MAAPKTLTPGSYIATVPAPADPVFTAWRQANKERVAIREVRQTDGYQIDDPNSIATYEFEVNQGPALDVPVIAGGGVEVKDAAHTVDTMSPTADPAYHANETPTLDVKEVAKWSAIVLAGLVILNAIVKKLLP